ARSTRGRQGDQARRGRSRGAAGRRLSAEPARAPGPPTALGDAPLHAGQARPAVHGAVYNLPIHRSRAMKSPSKALLATIATVLALAAPAFAALKPGAQAPDFSAPAYLAGE